MYDVWFKRRKINQHCIIIVAAFFKVFFLLSLFINAYSEFFFKLHNSNMYVIVKACRFLMSINYQSKRDVTKIDIN